jgi:hypothetical protein
VTDVDPRYGGARPSPAQLSRYLRTGSDAALRRRRWIVGLSLLGAGAGQVVAAYQTGILRHLPDPPVGPFDSDRVDASEYAYRYAATPDGLLMVLTFAVTAWLAGAGGQDRARHRPVLPLLMTAKVAGDVVTDLVLAREEWRENRALCAWCQAATGMSVASLALALPEARRAWRHLRG